MKTKYLLVAMVVLLAAGGSWAGRQAWRMHRQLVSLDVRNMPLAQVLRKIEWQTWKKIRAEKALDARITLHVTDKPLKYVLDRIGEQAGARWSTVYAVYQSIHARRALEGALAGDGKLESVGWTQVAPKMPNVEQLTQGGAGPAFRSAPVPDGSGATTSPEGSPPTDLPGPIGGQSGTMMFRRNRDGGVMFTKNSNGQTEMWSPQELVLETRLSARLGPEPKLSPTAQAAQQTARKLQGKWTSYLAFRKSSLGIGFAAPEPGRHGPEPFKHSPNSRFARLTPEQRVEQARQRMNLRVGPKAPGQ